MKLRLLFITHYCVNVFGFVTGLWKIALTCDHHHHQHHHHYHTKV